MDETKTEIKIEPGSDPLSVANNEYRSKHIKSEDGDLNSEIDNDLVIKTESSDLSEFIEQCHKEDISNEIRTKSEFIEPDEEIMNPVTIEEFFPQWNTNTNEEY